MNTPTDQPKWLRDVLQLLPIRAQFVLTGNIRDKVLLGSPDRLISLQSALWQVLEPLGFAGLLVWDAVDGLQAFPKDSQTVQKLSKIAELDLSSAQRMGCSSLSEIVRKVNAPTQTDTMPVALIIDYASRLRDEGHSPENVRELFVAAEKAALEARPQPRKTAQGAAVQPLFNPVFWLANRSNDLPYWLTVDNERIRSIPIPLPDGDARQRTAAALWRSVKKNDTPLDDFSKTLSGLTHNLSLGALQDIVSLANKQEISASDIGQAVQSFRVGDLTLQSPWRGTQLRERIVLAETGTVVNGKVTGRIADKVMGQSKAVTKVLDILKRTSIGLTGAQAPSSASRPRGVLFFVGPTGVGKTEMAKTIAQVVFGDPSAYLRFDMSEFSAEHSGDRLIGAPPGYVGFDQGGELTNALRERPFRVILFDEIEKAHYRILDKFLQVLEDGRLTDGRGETVYFSEALLVFTSNLGISRKTKDGITEILVTPETSPKEFEQKLMKGIHDHFTLELQRPELLNRIGENVVIFHYIEPEVGKLILNAMIENVRARIQSEQEIDIEIDSKVHDKLVDLCVGQQLLNGGRGIGGKLEAVFVNPLARLIFGLKSSGKIRNLKLTDLEETPDGYVLTASQA